MVFFLNVAKQLEQLSGYSCFFFLERLCYGNLALEEKMGQKKKKKKKKKQIQYHA